MKRTVGNFALFLFLTTCLMGCATTALYTPTPGILLTNVQGPITATAHPTYSKSGTASSLSILGLIGVGNASISSATQKAGITTIHHVDYKLTSFLVLFTKYTVTVYGD